MPFEFPYIISHLFLKSEKDMALPRRESSNPSGAPPLEWSEADARFFAGVFSEEQVDLANENVNPNVRKPPSIPEGFVSSTDVRDNDVFCRRGSGHDNPGNKAFRELIRTNKPRYDSMTGDDRQVLSAQLWVALRDQEKMRFLKPVDSNPKIYEVLDYERSVRKIFCALRDCRPKGGWSVVRKTNATKPKQVRWKPTEEKVVISLLYQNETLMHAMKISWKDQFDEKKCLFEDQVRLNNDNLLLLFVSFENV